MRKPMSKATIASTSSPNRGVTPQPVAQKLTTMDLTAENAQVHAPAHVRRLRSVRPRRDKGKAPASTSPAKEKAPASTPPAKSESVADKEKAPASTAPAQSESVANPVFMKVKFRPNETLQFELSFEDEPLEDMDSKVMKITVSTLKTVKETDTSKLLDLATVCCEPGVG